MSTVSSDSLIEKREQQLQTIAEINNLLSEKQQEVNNLSQSLTLNQGALYQLNALLEELGVDLTAIDQERTQQQEESEGDVVDMAGEDLEISSDDGEL
tara:strand:- start:3446 stop:3739 length:294 start_codon:yes stop_codon:yes gene_type:complete